MVTGRDLIENGWPGALHHRPRPRRGQKAPRGRHYSPE